MLLFRKATALRWAMLAMLRLAFASCKPSANTEQIHAVRRSKTGHLGLGLSKNMPPEVELREQESIRNSTFFCQECPMTTSDACTELAGPVNKTLRESPAYDA